MPRYRPPDHLPAHVLARSDFITACHARDLGAIFRIIKKWAGSGFTASHLSRRCELTVSRVTDYTSGRMQAQSLDIFTRVSDGLHIPGSMLGLERRPWETGPTQQTHEQHALQPAAMTQPAVATPTDRTAIIDDEADALELVERVAASDIGNETISRLERAFDDLAVAYSVTSPQELIERVRMHLGYVKRLMDARKTLDEHHRLLTVGGWLSLLAATVHIDLKQPVAATARLQTASSLAFHVGHNEIQAWCLETNAWRSLTDGDYSQALKLAQEAQRIAPAGSSALIQATAQEGRAWARLHQGRETYATMDRVRRLIATLPTWEQPGHHYQYDPDKVTAYSATTLAWLGDPAAEGYARDLLTNLRDAKGNSVKWPRRVASANLDLALTLLITNRLDEAAATAHSAISSGHVAPSNYWRALEVVNAVEARGLPEATDLREAYENLYISRARVS